MQKDKQSVFNRILRGIGFLIFGLVLALLFSLTVILGQPQNDPIQPAEEQILQAASPAVTFSTESDQQELLATFPTAGLLCTTEDLILVEGTCFDTAFENGFARVLRLIYENSEGNRFTVTSIYPQRAVMLLSDASLTMQGKGMDIAGYTAAAMSGNGRYRLHIQTDYGIYSVETAYENKEDLSDVLKKLQMIEK